MVIVYKTDKEDEPLPHGLHYSIDFSTGERKAKLLEPEEPNPDTESSLVLMPEKLEQAEIVQEEKPELTEAQKLSIKKINDYLNEQELVCLILIKISMHKFSIRRNRETLMSSGLSSLPILI